MIEPKIIEIKSCDGCPFMNEVYHTDITDAVTKGVLTTLYKVCSHSNVKDMRIPSNNVPQFCPLRKQRVVLRLNYEKETY